MIFKRGKHDSDQAGSQHVMRGRDGTVKTSGSSPGGDGNPLARRFHPDDEPDTVDLQQSADSAAVAVAGDEETATRDFTGSGEGQQAAAGEPLIRFAADTGKFYLQPGSQGSPVCLNGMAVTSVTELRPGDRIEASGAEFMFQPDRPA